MEQYNTFSLKDVFGRCLKNQTCTLKKPQLSLYIKINIYVFSFIFLSFLLNHELEIGLLKIVIDYQEE